MPKMALFRSHSTMDNWAQHCSTHEQLGTVLSNHQAIGYITVHPCLLMLFNSFPLWNSTIKLMNSWGKQSKAMDTC